VKVLHTLAIPTEPGPRGPSLRFPSGAGAPVFGQDGERASAGEAVGRIISTMSSKSAALCGLDGHGLLTILLAAASHPATYSTFMAGAMPRIALFEIAPFICWPALSLWRYS